VPFPGAGMNFSVGEPGKTSYTNSQNDLVEWGLFFGNLESALRGVIETGRFPTISSLFVSYGARPAPSSRLDLVENHSGHSTR
jgi:hypothetical protein